MSNEAMLAVLMERTERMEEDLKEVKDLQKAANGRVGKLETQMVEIRVYKRLANAIAGSLGGLLGGLAAWWVGK